MSFEKFLTNMQSMFTGFEENDEVLTKAHNIRLLFQKFQIPILIQVKNVLYNTTYTKTNMSQLTSFPTVWQLKHPTYPITSPTGKKVVWTPRVGGSQHQGVVLRCHTEPSLLYYTRTFNSYLMTTSRQYLTKESS